MQEPLSYWPRSGAICEADIWSLGTGMPKLRSDLANAAFFLYREDPQTGKRTGPHGTGFIYGVKSERFPNQLKHYYGVSNWHLTNDLGASIIRINTESGHRFIDLGPEDWQFIPSGDDLSICSLIDEEKKGDQVAHVTSGVIVDHEFIEKLEVGFGEDVFMIGLYADQHGGDKNTPAVRFGNLSLLADEKAPIEQPNGMMRPSHLVDMRSRTGFSGSPVSLYRIPDNDLSTLGSPPKPPRNTPLPSGYHQRSRLIALLGVHCGQYWDKVEVRKSPPTRRNRVGDPIAEGDNLYIPGAMNIVVPAWRITELLNLEVFQLARKERDERLADAVLKRAKPEFVDVKDVPETNDAGSNNTNPKHREDFTRLVGAAARKPAQED